MTTPPPPTRPGFAADDADALAEELLAGLRTRLGGTHIEHARSVAGRARVTPGLDDRAVAAGVLHDVVEHTETTLDELLARTGDFALVDLVDTLSHRTGESERDYLTRCAAHPVARQLKRFDLLDKLDTEAIDVTPGRAEELREQARQRLTVLEELVARFG